ncbi:protein translocase subunit SecD [Isoptericola sp. NEAU-Y5]|uniref:Protein translocase subunit SecD n=1 Tax=Isoptericola luteus TaxID=2879484 RepID=A0ABS7ZGA2_9MICO|nr:protein translocase subunit SecD [Isoptericola sp. NEAU-Y5]MCA5894038.1 protein translocase subunit SecD [Isoptericola sp. NEAU-Y5]
MANSRTKRSRPVRTLVVFTILTILLPFVALAAGVFFDGKSADNPDGASFVPGLALDLQGGTQLVLKAVTTDGSQVTSETIDESINVIRQRIDSSGVAEAEITAQGSDNIVVGIPGEVDQATLDLVSQPAQMRFRPVLTYNVGTPLTQEPADDAATEEGATDEGAADEDAAADEGAADDAATDDPSGAADEDGTSPSGKGVGTQALSATTDDPSAEATATATPTGDASTEPSTEPTEATDDAPAASDHSDLAQITPEIQAEFDALDCTDPANLAGGGGDDPDAVLVTCGESDGMKYILGPMEVDGTHIATASSGLVPGPNGAMTNEWGVFLDFDSVGTAEFRETTTRLQGLESPRNQFAIVLDGLVVSAPSLDPGVIISDGQAQISGSFDRESAATLANQLSFGALPIQFDVQSQEEISATLGSEQLRNGMIAGLIGLVLVVVYSLFQYRTLGLLTVGSLVVAGVMTYLAIAILSWQMGYRLSLAGVAGLIVAIGFTADSFIVYFERIRDEVRDGRSLSFAVERGWARARRTVLAAKSVNLISAIILYFLAVGGVQGFAFTLGLTTIIDVMVVFWFTHPMMEVLTRMKFFAGGHSWSGLSPERLRIGSGPRYVGAGRVAVPQPAMAGAPAASAGGEAAPLAASTPVPAPATDASGRRLTIAERRAAERKAAATADPPDTADPTAPEASGADQNEESR